MATLEFDTLKAFASDVLSTVEKLKPDLDFLGIPVEKFYHDALEAIRDAASANSWEPLDEFASLYSIMYG